MYETIIWATDGSEGASSALREALTLAGLTRGHIIAVHCDQRLNGRAGTWPKRTDEVELRTQIAHKVEALQHDGVDIELVIRRSHREAADAVAATAAELGGDIIVCGTRGLGAFAGAFLGSFTQRLLHVTPCPVVAVPERCVVSETSKRQTTAVGA
jgi:nucleotide-binding universal stress UspA family protein